MAVAETAATSEQKDENSRNNKGIAARPAINDRIDNARASIADGSPDDTAPVTAAATFPIAM